MNPLILALDVEPGEALPLVRELKPYLEIFKIGSRLFTSAGPQIVEKVHQEGRKVFLDLKFHDIPMTVAESCRNAVRMGVWGFTIHASGGFAMMKEAQETVRKESAVLKVPKPLIFGVTVLTSMSDPDLREIGVADNPLSQVRRLALLAEKAGLDGVVASGNEIQTVRENCAKNFLVAVPGIRPKSAAVGDQKRVMTPEKARALGADYVIVGRPILESKDKVAQTKEILSEVAST